MENEEMNNLINSLYFYNYEVIITYISHKFIKNSYEEKKEFLDNLLISTRADSIYYKMEQQWCDSMVNTYYTVLKHLQVEYGIEQKETINTEQSPRIMASI